MGIRLQMYSVEIIFMVGPGVFHSQYSVTRKSTYLQMGKENLPRYDLMFTVSEVLPLLFEVDLKKKS